jgi:endonuclease YncB( thermonuclease family)
MARTGVTARMTATAYPISFFRPARHAPGALAGFFILALAAVALAGCDAPPLPSAARDEVRVQTVRDGDSLAVTVGGQALEVRLHGIDAPEYDQPWGREARAALARLLEDAPLSLEVLDEDRYGRKIAQVFTGTRQQPVAAAMLRGGHAWLYRRYEGRLDWRALELEARVARRGLWAADDPVPPWSWRQRRTADAGRSAIAASSRCPLPAAPGEEAHCRAQVALR